MKNTKKAALHLICGIVALAGTVLLFVVPFSGCKDVSPNAPDTQDTLSDTIPKITACAGTADQPLAVVYPNGGEVLKVGQTIQLEFCTADTVEFPIADERRPGVYVSPDNGLNWIMVFEYISEPVVEWTIPSTLTDLDGNEISIVSTQCKLMITDYMVSSISDNSDSVFTIQE